LAEEAIVKLVLVSSSRLTTTLLKLPLISLRKRRLIVPLFGY